MTGIQRLSDLDDADLREVYAAPRADWFRLNFVVTVDGAAQGPDGLSKSINNPADKRVFLTLRRMADVLVVGAGTIRAEAYRPNPKPLVVVTRSGSVPPSLRAGDLSAVMVATGERAPALAETRELLGEDRVLVHGEDEPDLPRLVAELHRRGYRQLLSEGGPQLAGDLLAHGLLDEVCLTTVPTFIAGDQLRMATGTQVQVPAHLHSLVRQDDTLLARWFLERG